MSKYFTLGGSFFMMLAASLSTAMTFLPTVGFLIPHTAIFILVAATILNILHLVNSTQFTHSYTVPNGGLVGLLPGNSKVVVSTLFVGFAAYLSAHSAELSGLIPANLQIAGMSLVALLLNILHVIDPQVPGPAPSVASGA